MKPLIVIDPFFKSICFSGFSPDKAPVGRVGVVVGVGVRIRIRARVNLYNIVLEKAAPTPAHPCRHRESAKSESARIILIAPSSTGVSRQAWALLRENGRATRVVPTEAAMASTSER